MLCSAISKEESGSIAQPDVSKYPKLSEDEFEQKVAEIEEHNDSIQSILNQYQDRVDEIKKEMKRKSDEKNKELRLFAAAKKQKS